MARGGAAMQRFFRCAFASLREKLIPKKIAHGKAAIQRFSLRLSVAAEKLIQ